MLQPAHAIILWVFIICQIIITAGERPASSDHISSGEPNQHHRSHRRRRTISGIIPNEVSGGSVRYIETVYGEGFAITCHFAATAAPDTIAPPDFSIVVDTPRQNDIHLPTLPDEGEATYATAAASLSDEGNYTCRSVPALPGIMRQPIRTHVFVTIPPQSVAIRSLQQVYEQEHAGSLITTTMTMQKQLTMPFFPTTQTTLSSPLRMDEAELYQIACVVYNAKPAAKIQWLFNGVPVIVVPDEKNISALISSSADGILRVHQAAFYTREIPADQTEFGKTKFSADNNNNAGVVSRINHNNKPLPSLFNTISIIGFVPTRADNGRTLTCQALRDKLPTKSSSDLNLLEDKKYFTAVQLDVQYKPIVRQITINNSSADNDLIREGDAVTFTCLVDVNPSNKDDLNFMWTINGSRVQNSQDLTLQLSNISRAFDDRLVTCQAGNRLGSSQPMSRRVRIAYPPTFISSHNSSSSADDDDDDDDNTIAIDIGTGVSLECRAQGDPAPNINWYQIVLEQPQASAFGVVGGARAANNKNATLHEHMIHVESGTRLSLPAASESELGQYICQAADPAGLWPVVRKTFWIVKRGPPMVFGGVVKSMQQKIRSVENTEQLLAPSKNPSEKSKIFSATTVYSAALNSPARLECSIYSTPLPTTIIWMHPNGSEIARSFPQLDTGSSDQTNDTNNNRRPAAASQFVATTLMQSRYTVRALLLIADIGSERDFGVYNCTAYNSYGSASAIVRLEPRAAYDVKTLFIAGGCAVVGMLLAALILFCFLHKCIGVFGGSGNRRKRLKSQPSPIKEFGNGKDANNTPAVNGGNTTKKQQQSSSSTSSTTSGGSSVSSESVEMKSNTNSTQADNSLSGFAVGIGSGAEQQHAIGAAGKTSRLSGTMSLNNNAQRGALYQQRRNNNNSMDADYKCSGDIYIADLKRRDRGPFGNKAHSTSTTTIDDDEEVNSELSAANNNFAHHRPSSPGGAIMALANHHNNSHFLHHSSLALTPAPSSSGNMPSTMNFSSHIVPNQSPMLVSFPPHQQQPMSNLLPLNDDEVDLAVVCMQQQQQQQPQGYFAYANNAGINEYDPDAYSRNYSPATTNSMQQPFVVTNVSTAEDNSNNNSNNVYDKPPNNSGSSYQYPQQQTFRPQQEFFDNKNKHFYTQQSLRQHHNDDGRQRGRANAVRHLSLQRPRNINHNNNSNNNSYHYQTSSASMFVAEDDDVVVGGGGERHQIVGLPPADGEIAQSFAHGRFITAAVSASSPITTKPAFRFQPPRQPPPAHYYAGSLMGSNRQYRQQPPPPVQQQQRFATGNFVGYANGGGGVDSGGFDRAHSAVPSGGGGTLGRDFVMLSQLGTNV